jgi:hypothetical protein
MTFVSPPSIAPVDYGIFEGEFDVILRYIVDIGADLIASDFTRENLI